MNPQLWLVFTSSTGTDPAGRTPAAKDELSQTTGSAMPLLAAMTH